MNESSERNVDVSGVFTGHFTTDEDTRAIHMLASTSVDSERKSVTIEYQSLVSPGTKLAATHTNPEVVRAMAYEVDRQEKVIAADARRTAPVRPIPKPQSAKPEMRECPSCEGQKRYGTEPCSECLGKGEVPKAKG